MSPITLAASSPRSASVDKNGNFVSKLYRAEAATLPVVGLEAVMQLRPVAFAEETTEEESYRPFLGFLPTELRRAVPEAVVEDESGYCVTALIPVLVKAVQELAARVEALEAPDSEPPESEAPDLGAPYPEPR